MNAPPHSRTRLVAKQTNFKFPNYLTVPPPPPPMATATTAAEELELKTYWCHECDMSVALTSSPPPLLCPHCHTNFLEPMDSPTDNDVVSQLPTSFSFNRFDTSFFHRLFNNNHVISSTDTPNDVVFEDPLDLFSLALTFKTTPPVVVPMIVVTASLLSELDPNGVVSCAVCKDEIEVGTEAKQLPCKHLYHSDCITPWIQLHDSCPLCRFRISAAAEGREVVEGGNLGGGGDMSSVDIRSQLRAAMVRLSELMEEEEDDFYGLRTTLNHIASRHGLIDSDGGSREAEGEGGDSSERVSSIGVVE